MSKKTKLLVSIGIVLTLSGCGVLSPSQIEQKQAEVDEYNKLYQETAIAYKKEKSLAVESKDNLINYLLTGKEWGGITDDTMLPSTKLSDTEVEAFERNGVAKDTFFTALGASGLREVLIINGDRYRMYATVIWLDNKVYSIERKVVSL